MLLQGCYLSLCVRTGCLDVRPRLTTFRVATCLLSGVSVVGSEFCGLDACTDTSLSDSLLGREVPTEVSDLYSSGVLPVGVGVVPGAVFESMG